MDIQTQLMQYKYHLAIAASVSALVSSALYAAPRLGTILAFFWPLFASTALFVAAIVAFSGVSKLAVEAHGGGEGEDIVDFVAGGEQHMADDREERQSFE